MRKMYNQFRVGHDHTCLGYVCVCIYMYVWVFYNLFFTPLVKGGIFALGPGVSKHTTTDTESWDLTEFIRHINTAQGRRILYPLQDHTGSSEFAPSRAVWTSTECRGASSVVKKNRVRWLLVSVGGCYWMVWTILPSFRKLKPIRLRMRRGEADSADKRSSLLGERFSESSRTHR